MSDIPEAKTTEYSNYLDEIIERLQEIKRTLKRGTGRKENRKEVAHLQHAITSLRYLKGKNDRATEKMLLNGMTDDPNLKESFGYGDIRNFLMGIGKSDYDD
jgi:Mg2+ and Co2+ transporter CorA